MLTQPSLLRDHSHVRGLGMPLLQQLNQGAGAGIMPAWWSSKLPSLELHARVVDYWADYNDVSRQVSNYLRWLHFSVDFDTRRRQQPSACGFVAARVVNDLHAAGEAWLARDVRRAADQKWVTDGNMILGRIQPDQVNSGFMMSNDEAEKLVEGFWQNDALEEGRLDSTQWLPPKPYAVPLDLFMRQLVEDLHAVAVDGATLPLRLRIPNTSESNRTGLHWFTVAYTVRRRDAPAAHMDPQIDDEDAMLDDEYIERQMGATIEDEDVMLEDESIEREMGL